MGLFNPRSREEQAHFYIAKTRDFKRFCEINKEKSGILRLPIFGLSDKTWTCGLYHPNWFIYLFLAVFAFSEAFCYAKTAFSYSRTLLSPCTPDLFMVKDVVKSEYRMIVMWSLIWDGRSTQKFLRRQRRNRPTAVCGQLHTERW